MRWFGPGLGHKTWNGTVKTGSVISEKENRELRRGFEAWTYGLRVRSLGVVIASHGCAKCCIVPGQGHEVDSQELSLLVDVLRRARVEIVSRARGGSRASWGQVRDWQRRSASAIANGQGPRSVSERCAGSNPGQEPNERGDGPSRRFLSPIHTRCHCEARASSLGRHRGRRPDVGRW